MLERTAGRALEEDERCLANCPADMTINLALRRPDGNYMISVVGKASDQADSDDAEDGRIVLHHQMRRGVGQVCCEVTGGSCMPLWWTRAMTYRSAVS